MTRCVIDSDGLFVEEQYFDDGRESIEADVPEVGEHQAAKWTGSGWEMLPDYRGCLVYTANGEEIWQNLGDLPDGVSLEPNGAVNLSAAKSAKIAELNAAAQAFIGQASGADAVPDFELATWPLQSAEAQAWAADKTAATPILDGIAAARGMDADKLKTAALRKSLMYLSLSAHVAGQRQALQTKIEAAKTQAALDKIKIGFTPPEAV